MLSIKVSIVNLKLKNCLALISKMEYTHDCVICDKVVDLGKFKPHEGDEVTLFNYHDPENMCVLICSKSCQEKFGYTTPGCVMCNAPCLDRKWYVDVKFVNLGGWTSVRATCSEFCRLRLLHEETQDIELKYQCFACKKLSDTRLKRCGNCRVTYYCNVECQRSHWSQHKDECKK